MQKLPTGPKSRLVVVLTVCMAAGISVAKAGTSAYDMSGLIDEPHPFAADPYVAHSPAQYAPVRPAYAPRTAATLRPAPVQTAQAALPPAGEKEPSFLTLASGFYDINDNREAVELRIEWKGRKQIWAIKPLLGVMATTDGGVYGYGGIGWDLYFGKRVVVTPSFAVGAYRDGNGKDLGSAIEFRSALELAYRFDNDMRLGLMFYHLSNAGIDDNNPGTEVLSLGLSVPLR